MCSVSLRDQATRQCIYGLARDTAGFEWLSIESCCLFAFTESPGIEPEMPAPAKGAATGFKFINTRPAAGGAIVLRDHLRYVPLFDPDDIAFPRESRDCVVFGPFGDIYRVRPDSVDRLGAGGFQSMARHPFTFYFPACPFGPEFLHDCSVNR